MAGYYTDKLAYYTFTAAHKLGMQSVYGVNLGEYIYLDCGARVAEGIFIGSLSTATSQYCADLNNIGAIINLSGSDYLPPNGAPMLKIVMNDANVTPANMEDYIKAFGDGVQAIHLARTEGKNVLIHCAAGINRSATLIGFYLIKCGWTYEQVLAALTAANNSRGVQLLTNESFRCLLRLYDSFQRNFNGNYSR